MDYEYDPEYIAAMEDTVEGRFRRLGYALSDTGNEIALALLPHIIRTSSAVRAIVSEFHADEFERWPWYRKWWHIVTSHRA